MSNSKIPTTVITCPLSKPERETICNIYFPNDEACVGDRVCEITTLCMPDYNELVRKGWTLIHQYTYDDGTVCGGVFRASGNAISFRSVVDGQAKKREISEEQRAAASERLKAARKNK